MMRSSLSRSPSASDAAVRSEERSTEYAYRTLKARILDSEFAPGAFLLEKDAAAQLGLSRTPVREALVRLEQDGLLEIVPRHGARISVLSPADMRDIYEVLTSLEPTAAEILARRRPSANEVADLSEACTAMERALEEADLKAWAAADEAFHRNLAERCGNRRLSDMIMTVWDQSHRARMFTLSLRPLPIQSTREHRAILDTILAGEADAARELYRAHRQRGGAELMSIIVTHGFNRL
jgi:DNA-binding GntR family transcriptional regulator